MSFCACVYGLGSLNIWAQSFMAMVCCDIWISALCHVSTAAGQHWKQDEEHRGRGKRESSSSSSSSSSLVDFCSHKLSGYHPWSLWRENGGKKLKIKPSTMTILSLFISVLYQMYTCGLWISQVRDVSMLQYAGLHLLVNVWLWYVGWRLSLISSSTSKGRRMVSGYSP